jgi:hypothetical protein
MRAEPRDFQYATPMGFAEPAAYAEAEVDPSQIKLFAGDHVDAGSSSSGWSGKSVRDFVRLGDVGLIGRFSNIVGEFQLSGAVRSSLIAVGLIVAFGLGWTCASIFNSNSDASLAASDASLAPPAQRTDVSRVKQAEAVSCRGERASKLFGHGANRERAAECPAAEPAGADCFVRICVERYGPAACPGARHETDHHSRLDRP